MIEFVLKMVFTKGVPVLWENRKTLGLYLKTRFLKYRKQKIRFSISYLYRIRIPHSNQYLLVFNRKFSQQLQPVGGVYKRYGADQLFESWGYEPDCPNQGVGVDNKSEGDLRFRILGKNVIKAIKWFEEGMDREVSANREFKEELIDTGILDSSIFDRIDYRHIARRANHLQWSNHHNCYEVLIYDILDLLPTDIQKMELSKLAEANLYVPDKYAIVEGSDIQREKTRINGTEIRIGKHTKYTINQ